MRVDAGLGVALFEIQIFFFLGCIDCSVSWGGGWDQLIHFKIWLSLFTQDRFWSVVCYLKKNLIYFILNTRQHIWFFLYLLFFRCKRPGDEFTTIQAKSSSETLVVQPGDVLFVLKTRPDANQLFFCFFCVCLCVVVFFSPPTIPMTLSINCVERPPQGPPETLESNNSVSIISERRRNLSRPFSFRRRRANWLIATRADAHKRSPGGWRTGVLQI